jgi:hypothetical protein
MLNIDKNYLNARYLLIINHLSEKVKFGMVWMAVAALP